jgi:hypothetical protein
LTFIGKGAEGAFGGVFRPFFRRACLAGFDQPAAISEHTYVSHGGYITIVSNFCQPAFYRLLGGPVFAAGGPAHGFRITVPDCEPRRLRGRQDAVDVVNQLFLAIPDLFSKHALSGRDGGVAAKVS